MPAGSPVHAEKRLQFCSQRGSHDMNRGSGLPPDTYPSSLKLTRLPSIKRGPTPTRKSSPSQLSSPGAGFHSSAPLLFGLDFGFQRGVCSAQPGSPVLAGVGASKVCGGGGRCLHPLLSGDSLLLVQRVFTQASKERNLSQLSG